MHKDEEREGGDRRAPAKWQFLIPVLSLFFSVVGAWAGSQSRTAVLESNFASLKETVTSQGNETRTTLGNLTQRVDSSNQKTGEALAANNKEIENLRRENSALRDDVSRADDKLSDAIKLQELRVDGIGRSIATIQGELNAERKYRKNEEK